VSGLHVYYEQLTNDSGITLATLADQASVQASIKQSLLSLSEDLLE